jgi:two-component system, OmpR family, sensor histidine kinase MprB
MRHRLSLRARLALIAATATALTALSVALFGYGLARRSVMSEIDASLLRDHQRLESRFQRTGGGLGLNQELDAVPIALVNGSGRLLRSTPAGTTAVDPIDVKVASGAQFAQFSDRTIEGRRYRMYTSPAYVDAAPTFSSGPNAEPRTVGDLSTASAPAQNLPASSARTTAGPTAGQTAGPTAGQTSGPTSVPSLRAQRAKLARFDRKRGGPGLAIVVGRDVQDAHKRLHSLAVGFAVLAFFGVGISGVAALVAVRLGTRPLENLNAITHAIATDGRSNDTVPATGPPDIRRLATSFNAMIAALHLAQDERQRMIDDAAHELRTPLTSMQTNLDMLSRSSVMLDSRMRQELLSALTLQFRELRTLVDDLGLLAEQSANTVSEFAVVDLGEVASRAVLRARQRSGQVTLSTQLCEFLVCGHSERLERAILNVIDNAIKWSPTHGTVSIVLQNGELLVSDHGPGIVEGERERVFERFWRSEETRQTPGSGLGLAIVADVVAAHRGTVNISETLGGGTTVSIRLPRYAAVRTFRALAATIS